MSAADVTRTRWVNKALKLPDASSRPSGAGWDTAGFAAYLAPAMGRLTLHLPSGRPVVADLSVARHTTPVMPSRW
jgi:hypothetical protein